MAYLIENMNCVIRIEIQIFNMIVLDDAKQAVFRLNTINTLKSQVEREMTREKVRLCLR